MFHSFICLHLYQAGWFSFYVSHLSTSVFHIAACSLNVKASWFSFFVFHIYFKSMIHIFRLHILVTVHDSQFSKFIKRLSKVFIFFFEYLFSKFYCHGFKKKLVIQWNVFCATYEVYYNISKLWLKVNLYFVIFFGSLLLIIEYWN